MIQLIKNAWQFYSGQGFPCLFHLLTGFYCPGCGGTRAVKALLRGDIMTSLHYHPFVVYMAAAVLIETVIFLYEKKKKIPLTLMRRFQIWVWIGAAVCGGSWIWKNIRLLYGIAL